MFHKTGVSAGAFSVVDEISQQSPSHNAPFNLEKADELSTGLPAAVSARS